MIVDLRAQQLKDWRALRETREAYWRRKGARWWFHLINLALAPDWERKAFVTEIIRFLRLGYPSSPT